MSYGVPNPYVATTHPYPTRYHGGVWTRPVFGMPYQRSVQSVFKPTDFNDGNPSLRAPGPGRPLGELLVDAANGVFGTEQDGGGVFGPALYGLGADGCTLPADCVRAKQVASQYFNTSLLDGYCDQDGNGQNEIWNICSTALARAGAAGSAVPTGPNPTTSFTAAQVLSMQKTLNAELAKRGYAPIGADGKLGSGTCGAIAWYQKSTGNAGAGASYATACAAKQPWSAPMKRGDAPGAPGPSTDDAANPPYTPPGPSKATMFAVGGGILAVVAVIVGKKRGWF